jgi:hypothetical protein
MGKHLESAKKTLQFNIDVTTPHDEHLLGKYLLGTRFLLNYKNYLISDNNGVYDSFLEIYDRASRKSLLDQDRMFMLYQMVLATNHLGDHTAECGVYRGGGSILIADSNNGRSHYAIDSFEGLPPANPQYDHQINPDFSDVSFKDVQSDLSGWENIFLLKGFFTDIFPGITMEEFAFVHIDADLYDPTLECCEFFYPRMKPGAIMLFDDYLLETAAVPGVKKATGHFFADKPEFVITLPTCQGMVVKT